jgi:hypothetical protein
MLVTTGSEGYAGNVTQRVVTRRQGEKVEGRVEALGEAPEAARAERPGNGAASVSGGPDTASSGSAPAAAPLASAPAAGSAATAAGAAVPERPATERSAPPGARVLATLRWRDALGEHAFAMLHPTLKIGRGGQGFWVDVKLDTLPDVSREHVLVRHDEAAGGFFVQDLSRYGTSVNGARLPARPEGSAEGGRETPLALPATLDLAGAITLEIEPGPA